MVNLTEDTLSLTDWNVWIENDLYRDLVVSISKYVNEITSEDIPTDYFTPHDGSHCRSVEKIVKALINKSRIRLSDLEKFLLFTAVWTHDIGMLEVIARDYLDITYSADEKRAIHELISAWFLYQDEGIKNIFKGKGISDNLIQNYINTITIISKFHRRKYDIEKCPKIRYIKGEPIRTKLIAALLRLGDTLHVDSTRYDRRLYNILQIGHFDRTARLHWLKSYVVSTVHLDINTQTIFVLVDLPDPDGNSNGFSNQEENGVLRQRLTESAERLKFILSEDILEDVNVVKDVFKEEGLPFYESVKVNINLCPGMPKNLRDEIYDILNDLDIVLSPNTSRVMRKALASISSLSNMKFRNYEHFYNQTRQLIAHLEKIYQQRQCHIGLKKIIEELKDIFKKFPGSETQIQTEFGSVPNQKIADFQNQLKTLSSNVTEKRVKAIKAIEKKAPNILSDIKHVFLFGYSEIVLNFLKAVGGTFRRKVNLYVFECSGKRRFSVTNRPEYNDGVYYALSLAKAGFKRVSLLPDTSFPSLLVDLQRNKKSKLNKNKAVLLFGANGICEKDKSCGHTSGHLMMAIVAKEFNIPLYVITDKFKFGDIEWNPSLKREGTEWLAGDKMVISELLFHGIQLVNYREDSIKKEMIKLIITEEGNEAESGKGEFFSPTSHTI